MIVECTISVKVTIADDVTDDDYEEAIDNALCNLIGFATPFELDDYLPARPGK